MVKQETALAIPAPTAPLGLEEVKDDEDLMLLEPLSQRWCVS